MIIITAAALPDDARAKKISTVFHNSPELGKQLFVQLRLLNVKALCW